MESVTVFMSTYNGDKYLREQIDSILNQGKVKVYLYVRDDGSSDGTINILNEYQNKDQLIFCKGKNLGYGKSFLELFKFKIKDTNYYAFSDQDDVWEKDKLYQGISKLKLSKSVKGKLYFCNMKIVDSNLKGNKIKDFCKVKISLGSVLVRQRIAGCVMVFDNYLFQKAKQTDFLNYKQHISHEWVYLLCLAFGGDIIKDNNAYINYRRHENTATSIGQGFKSRIKSELKQFNVAKNDKYYLCQLIIKNYYDDIDPRNKNLLLLVSKYKKSLKARFLLLFSRKLNSGNFILNARIKFFILLGIF